MTQPKREPSQRARDAARKIAVQVVKSRKGWSSRTVAAIEAGHMDTHDAVQGALLALAEAETPVPNQLRGEVAERASVELTKRMLADQIEREGRTSSYMIRAGLLDDILTELASLRESALSSPSVEAGCNKIFDHKWLDPECIESGCQSLRGRHLMKRLYEVVHHEDGCKAIGGAGDADCTCDAVPLLRELEAIWHLPVGTPARQSKTPAGEVLERADEWRPVEICPMWQVAIVTDGERAAVAQRAENDFGMPYWAIDPEDGLEWEPTLWSPIPQERTGE